MTGEEIRKIATKIAHDLCDYTTDFSEGLNVIAVVLSSIIGSHVMKLPSELHNRFTTELTQAVKEYVDKIVLATLEDKRNE